jgi:dihydrofolate reductase
MRAREAVLSGPPSFFASSETQSGGTLPGVTSAGDERGSVQRIPLVLVAAVADNGVIGRENSLPWRLSSDLRHFRALTLGRPVIMGRRTFQSIGRPLDGRTNIVVSGDPAFAAPGVIVARNLEAGLLCAQGDAARRGADAVIISGGEGIFVRTLPLADRLEITRVHLNPEGDTFFPAIDATVWREVARSEHSAGPKDEASFSFITYARDGGMEAAAPLGR